MSLAVMWYQFVIFIVIVIAGTRSKQACIITAILASVWTAMLVFSPWLMILQFFIIFIALIVGMVASYIIASTADNATDSVERGPVSGVEQTNTVPGHLSGMKTQQPWKVETANESRKKKEETRQKEVEALSQSESQGHPLGCALVVLLVVMAGFMLKESKLQTRNDEYLAEPPHAGLINPVQPDARGAEPIEAGQTSGVSLAANVTRSDSVVQSSSPQEETDSNPVPSDIESDTRC